ncbi:MAG: hypothetical protein IT276_11230 [Ignavibacteriaceae bacterium]|nr:hypothetical protein [Ignavibacterium sp.]MCC6255479.1 hypothetical protein [Ignavibacteriaceae bacterium]HMN26492.1 hypothetical protein [Ignavibacteriaceae bacterium]HRN27245.1 hypothetical protein [Ignavibacteriaceae bacterium]HRP91390.1 hypothetical protein [Ignavibacteriaceae bacterium]
MKNSFALAVLISFIFSVSQIYSQGIFLEKGEAGVFLNGGYTGLESGYATSFGGGFALGGIFEFGFSSTTSTIELNNYYYSKDIRVSSNTVSLGVVLIKKKAQLELNLGYSTSDVGSDAFMVGFNVGSKIQLHKDISWYPILSFAVGIPTAENSGNPVTAVGATLPLFIAKHFYLGPSFGLSDGNTSWGFTAGILISFDIDSNEDGGW